MGKHLFLSLLALIILMVVTTSSPAQDADPSLVGYWKFDGDWLDSSGNGRSGTPVGDATFGPGLEGQALSLDGSGDYVTIDSWMGIEGGNPFTISLWVNSTATNDRTMVCWGSSTNGQRVDFRLFQGRLRVEHGNGNLQGDTVLADGEWHHAALTVAAGASIQQPGVTLYLDGVNDSRTTTDPDTFDITPTVPVTIGQRRTHNNRPFLGLLDELRIYDRELTAAEIEALAVRPKAYNPSPADGTVGVTNPLLSWTPRETALFHDVYLGTDPNLGPDQLVAPRWTGAVFWYGPGLEPGTTYFWKIDEIDPDLTVHPGDVWSFTVAPVEAWSPIPAPDSQYVDTDTELRWSTGFGGASHDVYFGDNADDVASGTGDTFKGNQFPTTYATGPLEVGTTYFWRVDEVAADGTKVTGAVWSFTTVPEIPIVDPNLLGWWTLDEGAGTRAVDWSGNSRHADFGDPAPAWAIGTLGGALEFTGSGESAIHADGTFLNGLDALTITIWVKSNVTNTDKGFIIFENPVGNDDQDMRYDAAGANGGGSNLMKMGLTVATDTGNSILQLESSDDSQSTDWQHLALVWSSGQQLQLYINGVLDAPTDNRAAVAGTLTGNQVVIIGKGGKDQGAGDSWDGLIDEVRLYNKALTQDEITLAMRGNLLLAWEPSPANGVATDALKASPLTWQPGDEAAEHDVYLGTDRAAVAAADTTDASGIYRGRVNVTSHVPDPALEWGQQYFWRIDEINNDGSVTTGVIWSFTVTDYLIVDDMEGYTDDLENGEAIFQTWLDGVDHPELGGSAVGNLVAPFAEQTIVQEGKQSLSMAYDNTNSPWFSMTSRDLVPTQDWTVQGLTDLTLWVRGKAASFAEIAPDHISMSGGGTDIWGTADEFRFAHKILNGNGSMTARVTGVGAGSNAWAKGGIMIRQDLQGGSVNVLIAVTGGQGDGGTFQWRPAANEASQSSRTLTGIAPPYWVRLVREGNTFTGYMSPDGENWAQQGTASVDIAMTDPVFIGLAVTSHQAGELRGYSFDNITTTGNVTGAWRTEDVGVFQGDEGNDPADLYLIIESIGGSAKVKHPDPIVLTPGWYKWVIPLDSLTGVNLTRVRKVKISVGDPDAATPDGDGQVFADDIRVEKLAE